LKLDAKILQKAKKILERIATQVVAEAKEESPKKTSALAVDISYEMEDDLTAIIGNTGAVPYAVYVHQGTKAHEIRAKNKKALYWKGGHPVKKVDHPGTKANPYLERALHNIVSTGKLDKILERFYFEDDFENEVFESFKEEVRSAVKNSKILTVQ